MELQPSEKLKTGIHELIKQVETNVSQSERRSLLSDDEDTGKIALESVRNDYERSDESEKLFYAGALAARLEGLSYLDSIVAGLAHMFADQGCNLVTFYRVIPPCLPTDENNGLEIVDAASKRLRKAQLWPWSVRPSRATEIVAEAGF